MRRIVWFPNDFNGIALAFLVAISCYPATLNRRRWLREKDIFKGIREANPISREIGSVLSIWRGDNVD